MARRLVWALLAVVAMTATGRAATVRTANFVVETARQDDADEFARLAEMYRKQKALDWLGYEMPRWKEPCRLRVTVSGSGAASSVRCRRNARIASTYLRARSIRGFDPSTYAPMLIRSSASR